MSHDSRDLLDRYLGSLGMDAGAVPLPRYGFFSSLAEQLYSNRWTNQG